MAARRFDPLVEAVIDVIAERVPDFDPEVIADLIEVVADDAWVSALGPAVDQVMQRIGLGSHVASSDQEPSDHASKSLHTQMPEPQGNIAVVACNCPYCAHTFFTTLAQIANNESDNCPHCGEIIVPELAQSQQPPEKPELPNEGGP